MYNIGDEVEFWVVADYKDSKWCPRWQKGIVVDIHYYNLCITIRDQYGQVININADQTSPIKKVRKTENNQMKKSDLKNRMIVETRNGNRFIVVDEYLLDVNGRGYMLLDSYSDDLMNKSKGLTALAIKINRGYDIMKVYDRTISWDYHNEDDLLWERSEPVEMSFDEIQKILGINNLKIKMSSNEIISRCNEK